MPVATTTSASPRLPATSKMDKDKIEDRKRPAGGNDDGAPPRKKLAVNGNAAKDDFDNQPEEAWIENFAKGAIYRRMQEYKREAATYSARLEELHKRSLYHDDHIRMVDAWWRQLLEEIQVIADGTLPNEVVTPDPPYLSGVGFKDSPEFQKHIDDRHKQIRSKAELLMTRIAASRGTVEPKLPELESRINTLLAAQKEYFVKLDRLTAEKEQLSEQLNTATLRYFKAEKRLDRAKSSQVHKLEQQALASDTKSTTSGEGSKDRGAENGANNTELLMKYEEECAVSKRQREQIESALAESKALQEELSSLQSRRESTTDEDFIRTDVFKLFRTKCEDLIKQVNHLEATNTQLRDEIERLNSDRTNFKRQLEADAQALTQDLDADLLAREHDLARIRSARDEILAENTMRKASQEQEQLAHEQMKELISAKDDRILALESELDRLRPKEDAEMTDSNSPTEEIDHAELLAKYRTLQRDFEAINKELPAIEKAYKKAMSMAHKKVMSLDALEEKCSMLIAEKGKADQKYFAARKDADTRNGEIRSLRIQNGKSAEIIAQLKEIEAQNRALQANLEKQLAVLRQANATLTAENKKLEVSNGETVRKYESMKKELAEVSSLVRTKDSALASGRERNIAQEVEIDRLKVRTNMLQKDRDSWRTRAESNYSVEEQGLRTLMLCSICNDNFKNTALKTCGHLFCATCVENRLVNRMRKCPNCSRAFDRMDVMAVHH